jgi:hypothetical protein
LNLHRHCIYDFMVRELVLTELFEWKSDQTFCLSTKLTLLWFYCILLLRDWWNANE